jgi:hypothetical protein
MAMRRPINLVSVKVNGVRNERIHQVAIQIDAYQYPELIAEL